MKNSLIQENKEIIQEICEIKALLKDPTQIGIMNKCLFNFRNLSNQWQDFVHSSEASCRITRERNSKTQSKILTYKKIIQKNNIKLKKINSQEKEIIYKQEQITSQLSTFPKLWKNNLRKLKRKSMSWRVTPFASPQYDQEFSFMNTKREPVKDEENINYSVEFEKIMQEIEANRQETVYDPDKFSIEKSVGGWKSELESECENSSIHNVSEIKKAISILHKANLLKPESRKILTKITDIVKNPENSNNLVLFLQLLNINNSLIPSFADKPIDHDVKMEELLDATSYLSGVGLKMLESSLMEMSSEEICTRDYKEFHKKTMSLGKNSTKDMTEQLDKN